MRAEVRCRPWEFPSQGRGAPPVQAGGIWNREGEECAVARCHQGSRVSMRTLRYLQNRRWRCAGAACADRLGIRKSPCHLRPTCLESLQGGDPASGPRSWSQAAMMSSMPAPRGWKGEGDAGLWRHGLKKKMPAGHCPRATWLSLGPANG